MSSVYQRNKGGSQSYLESQKRIYNPTSQVQLNTSDFSPKSQKHRKQTPSNKNKVKQVISKIQDVIELCSLENQEVGNQFEGVIQAERGILDMLYEDKPQRRGGGGLASNVSQPARQYNQQGRPTSNQGNQGINPFHQIQQRPEQEESLKKKDKRVLGDEAIGMIEAIQKKALLEIQSLRREKAELLRMLNQEIAAHNQEKRRRIWLEEQLQRIIAHFSQQGFKIGQIQYPPWYNQIPQNNQPVYDQSGYGYLANTVTIQNPNEQQPGYQQPGYQQPNYQQPLYSPQVQTNLQRPLSPGQSRIPQQNSQHSPSFASQQNNYDNLNPGASQSYGIQYPNNPQYSSNPQYPQYPQYSNATYPNIPQYPSSTQYPSNPQYPSTNPQYSSTNPQYPGTIPQYNQTTNVRPLSPQPYQSTVNNENYQYIPGYQSQFQSNIQYPPKIQVRQSYEQIIPNNQYNKPYSTQYPQIPSYKPQQYDTQYNDNYQSLKNHLRDLRIENQNLRQNYNPEDDLTQLKQRLNEAERRAQEYRRQMEKWRSEAEKRGQYPGLLKLLEEGDKIRHDTIKLIKMREGNNQGNRYGEQNINERSYKGEGTKYNPKTKKGKASFQTDFMSRNQYQNLVEQMRKVTRN